MIMTGAAAGGTWLRTEHLAERLGMSATPVREGLMTLHGEGMVEFHPGRGFSVVPVTRTDVLDLYDAQAYLSGELAARAATRLDDDELRLLHELQEKLVVATDTGELDATEHSDFEIHRMINRSACAPKLTLLLRSTLRYVPYSAYGDIPGWSTAARDDHLPILRGLANRSPWTARDAMRAHIRNAGDLLADFLAQRGVLVDGHDPV